MTDPTIFMAFAAGLLSFASPCVLPLVPGYLSVLTGNAVTSGPGTPTIRRTLGPSLLFCLSFILVFVALGLFATGIGAPLARHRTTLEVVSGVLLMMMGALYLLAPLVPRLNRSARPAALLSRAATGNPALAGMAFALAWTPCTGPILGAILTAAATRSGTGGGAFLLLFYGLGLAVPFLLAALAFERVTSAARIIRDHYRALSMVGGVILLIVGWLTANHEMTRLASETRQLIDDLGLAPLLRTIER
ncbi:cytochrome c biogenesis protein CcdA [Patulibacter brassicae]|uniref:Cytochrome c biogenesis protein CcdA n=1 Tax=Patulibacter brassicae TaxID=1705717 RepID=A0ABU4VNG2_9ACTN|nr:cytochrome c biogenesis protein CcdA [Patulibacter brassicae]MDX8153386.1 cytochrome c biogenesis protein CcdA [Patulibacter brassicae]